jgi:hypothetical protein
MSLYPPTQVPSALTAISHNVVVVVAVLYVDAEVGLRETGAGKMLLVGRAGICVTVAIINTKGPRG